MESEVKYKFKYRRRIFVCDDCPFIWLNADGKPGCDLLNSITEIKDYTKEKDRRCPLEEDS